LCCRHHSSAIASESRAQLQDLVEKFDDLGFRGHMGPCETVLQPNDAVLVDVHLRSRSWLIRKFQGFTDRLSHESSFGKIMDLTQHVFAVRIA